MMVLGRNGRSCLNDEFLVLDFEFWVLGFGFWVLGFGLGIKK